MRTFIAIDISDGLKSQLAALQSRFRKFVPNLKFTAPHQLHLTLKFLGEIDVAQPPPAVNPLQQITRTLESIAAKHKPFDLNPKMLGNFGRPSNVTVVWLGLTDPSNELHKLHADIEFALARLGFPPEERPFKAHLTVARNKNPNLSRNIRQAMEAEAGFKGAAERVRGMTLYQSRLESTAPRYTELGRFWFC